MIWVRILFLIIVASHILSILPLAPKRAWTRNHVAKEKKFSKNIFPWITQSELLDSHQRIHLQIFSKAEVHAIIERGRQAL